LNHITQRNRLETQQRKYIQFMKICSESSVIKLSQEIAKIELRLDQMREYDLNKLMKPFLFQYITKQSKLNRL